MKAIIPATRTTEKREVNIPQQRNIPSPDEITELATLFGYGDKHINDAIELSKALEESLSHFSDLSEDDLLNIKEEHIGYIHLSGGISVENYTNFLIKDKKLRAPNERTTHHNLMSSRFLGRKNQITILHNTYSKEKKQHKERSLEDYGLLIAVSILGMNSSVIKKQLSHAEIFDILVVILFHPGFLHATTTEEQEKFCDLFFSSISRTNFKNEAVNIESILGKHLLRYFGDIKAFQKYISTDPVTQAGQSTSEEAMAAVNDQEMPEGLPSVKEMKNILTIMGEEGRLDHIKLLVITLRDMSQNNTITSIEDMKGLNDEDVIWALLTGCIQTEMLNQNLPVNRNDEGYMTGDEAFEDLLTSQISTKKQQQPVIISLAKDYRRMPKNKDFDDELLDMILALTIVNYNINLVNKYIDVSDFLSSALILIFYPDYLLKASTREQDRFFELFFASLHGKAELLDKESFLWLHLIKYFGEVDAVKIRFNESNSPVALPSKKNQAVKKSQNTGLGNPRSQRRKEKPNNSPNRYSHSSLLVPEDEVSKLLSFLGKESSIEQTLSNQGEMENFLSQYNPADYTDRDKVFIDFEVLLLTGRFDKDGLTVGFNSQEIIQNIDIVDISLIYLVWTRMSSELQETTMKRLCSQSLSQLSEKNKILLSLIICKGYQDVGHTIDSEHFINTSSGLLITPYYLNNIQPNQQETFFNIWFESMSSKDEISDPGSDIWKHLNSYFGKISAVKNRYKEISKPQELNVDKISASYDSKLDIFLISSSQLLRTGEAIYFMTYKRGNRKTNSKVVSFLPGETIQIDSYSPGRDLEAVILNQGEGNSKSTFERNQSKVRTIKVAYIVDEDDGNEGADNGNEGIENDTNPNYIALENEVAKVSGYIPQISGNRVFFKIDAISREFLQQHNLEGLITTMEIVYDISDDWPKLISYLGMNNYEAQQESLLDYYLEKSLDIITERVEKIKRENDERKRREGLEESERKRMENEERDRQAEDIAAKIQTLPELPDSYTGVRDFAEACKEEDLEIIRGTVTLFHWQTPRAPHILDGVKNDIAQLGYLADFNLGSKGQLLSVELSNSNAGVSFDVASTGNIDNMPIIKQENLDESNEVVFRHILKDIVSRFLSESYESSPVLKAKKNKIKKLAIKLKKLKDQTLERIENEEASFVKGWEEKYPESVSKKHPKINTLPIMGRRGFVKINSRYTDQAKLNARDKETRKVLLNGDSNYPALYLYNRFLVTKGIAGFSEPAIKNVEIERIIAKHSFLLIKTRGMKHVRAVCEIILDDCFSEGLTFEAIKPKAFTYTELLRR